MRSRRQRLKEEAAAREAVRVAHLEGLPTDVQPIVRDGWKERDAHFERLGGEQRARGWKLVRDGAVLFLTVGVLMDGFAPGPLALSVLVGAGVGALWIPLVGNRVLGLQLAAPLTAMPVYVLTQGFLGGGSALGMLGRICGAAILGLLAVWIGLTRDQELGEA